LARFVQISKFWHAWASILIKLRLVHPSREQNLSGVHLERGMPAWMKDVSKHFSLSRISPYFKTRVTSWQSAAPSISAHPSGESLGNEVWPGLASRLRGLLSHPFIRSVTVVVSGRAAAQLITIAFSPLITRLYGPEAFGALGIFLAAVAFITPIGNLSYSYAIVLPASDDEARALFKLSVLIGLAIASFSAMAFGGLHQQVAELIGFTAAPEILLLAPLAILLSVLREPLQQWLCRKKEFAAISRIAVATAAVSNVFKTVTGFAMATAPVLLLLTVLTQILELVLLWSGVRRTLPSPRAEAPPREERAVPASLRNVAYRFRDFPLFRTPNDWLNVASNSIPSLMLAASLGPAAAGFYLLAYRIVGLPNGVIAGAVGTVFLPRLAEASHRSERLRPLLVKGTLGLAAVGLIPFGIVIVAGPWLFGLVFGAQWTPSGDYARWLALWFYCAFAAVPSVKVIPILGLQGHSLLYEIIVVALRVSALAVGTFIYESDIAAIALYAIVGALVNVTRIAWCVLSCDTRLRDSI
jgi:O-antigen/teichoic acid export membrane protein